MPDDAGPLPQLQTLGRVGLRLLDGRERIGAGKPLALLVYLACSPRRTATREHLLDLLWSDLPPDKGRHALRQILWYLRQALGDVAILSRGIEIVLVLPLQFDRDDFLRAIAEGDAERAVAVYGGDFLTGFAAPGGAEFEHWADLEREQLRTVFLRTGESLARQWLHAGRIRDAQTLARRMRDTAPRHEAAWRLLLETLVAGGDTLALTLETAALEQGWRSDDRELEPTTRALLGRIAGASPETVASPPTGLLPELVGREPEFAALLGAWERARRGTAVHLHLSGAAGLGKSRLLDEARKRFRGLGVPVVTLRAIPAEREIAYGFLGALVGAISERPGTAAISPAAAGALVALHPSLSSRYAAAPDSASGDEALRRRAAALQELIAAAADEAPFVLLLDDMHWLDGASRQVLAATVKRLEASAVLTVTAGRYADATDESADQRIELAPLSEAEITRLLTSLGSLPDLPWALSLPAALRDASDGVPLLVLEALQLALDRGSLRLAGGQWECPAPADFARQLTAGGALKARIEALPQERRWLLLVLAVAGAPLSRDETQQAAGVNPPAAEGGLLHLEQQGFARRAGADWLPAHDEIAAAVMDLAAGNEIRTAHLALGRMRCESRRDGRPTPLHAARHFRAANATQALEALFARHLAESRARGDTRRVPVIAAELLGPDSEPGDVGRLVRSLAPWNRLRFSSAGRALAVGGAVVLLVGGAFRVARTPTMPDAVLMLPNAIRAFPAEGRRLELRLETWQAGVPLETDDAPMATLPSGAKGAVEYEASPDGKSALFVREHFGPGDSTTYDIYISTADRVISRLTKFRGDDGNPDWAPDQSAFVFYTSQWSPPEADNFDLAVMDLATHTVRPLTSGRGADREPRYAPDGTRIGFIRRLDDRLPTFCWIPQEGGVDPVCPEIPGIDPLEFVGWTGDQKVLIVADSSAVRILVAYDLATGVHRALDREVITATLSPDHRWLAVWRTVPGGAGTAELAVYPADDPGRARPVRLGSLPLQSHLLWLPSAKRTPYLDRVRIAGLSGGAVPVGGSLRLTLDGWDQYGGSHPPPASIRWSSSDTTRLTVDSLGNAMPRQPGRVTIHADLAGWRRDSLPLTIVEPSDSIVFREDWSGILTGQWIPFGDPRPELFTGPDGVRGFWNRGDGSYTSGAYTRAHWKAEGGLGVEARISIPLTRGQGQVATLELVGGLDSLRLKNWDHFTGGSQRFFPESAARKCEIGYPNGEGPLGKMRVGVSRGLVGVQLPVDSTLGRGQWLTVRLQIFPDGRCGIALNSQPIQRDAFAILRDQPFAVRLGYTSAGTHVLHGPIEVWQGVRTDIDWDALDTPSAALAGAGRPR